MAKKLNLKEKNPAELTDMLAKQREELRTLRFSSIGGRPQDAAAPKKTRAMIARLMTELHARKQGAAAEAPAVETTTA